MRRRLFLLGGVAVLAVVASFWIYGPNDERTRLVMHESHGSIVSGSRLGVSIGDPWAKADATLRRQFTPGDVLWQAGAYESEGGTGLQLSDSPILHGRSEVTYFDTSWRNGVFILKLEDGRVVAISWHYPGPFYIDL